MKKLIYFSVLMLVGSITIHAQQDNDKPLYMYHTTAQFQTLDFNDFNQELNNLNFLNLPNNIGEVGIGVTQSHRRFLSKLTLVYGSARNQLNNGSRSEFRYVNVRPSIAFNALNPESDWFLGPEISFNMGFQQILVTGVNNGVGFQQAALNSVYVFGRISSTTDIGFNFNKKIHYTDLFKEDRIMMIGLSGGYRVDNQDEIWDLNQAIALNDFSVVTGGWFGALTIGITLY